MLIDSALLMVQYKFCGTLLLFDLSEPIFFDIIALLIGQYQCGGSLEFC
jgi:hypothetical protein